jgi:two-component system NtrC family response regulator
MPEFSRILVIDDDESFRKILEYNLKQAGYEVATAANGSEGLAWIEKDSFGAVLTDIKMPGVDGLAVLREVKKRAPETAVIVITAYGSIEMAVEAMKEGAYDYVTKPLNRDALLLTLEKALRYSRLKEENLRLRRELGETFDAERLVGASAAFQDLVAKAVRLAQVDAPVLITGETGTGKDLVARSIHYNSSRRDHPFVAVNCAAIPRELLESELFGHVKGAFTGATRDRKGRFHAADRGTLFLDEIGSLELALQAKLLRVLQDQNVCRVGEEKPTRVNVRILAATNADLRAEVERGEFREDLYYRLNVVELRVPPLRERPEDIPPLVDHFIALLAPGKKIRVDPEVIKAFQAYRWPGNVRELRNVLERMLIFATGETLGRSSLPPEILGGVPSGTARKEDSWIRLPPEGAPLEELEREIILQALERNEWNQARASRFLKIPRHILLYRMEKYGIRAPGTSGH